MDLTQPNEERTVLPNRWSKVELQGCKIRNTTGIVPWTTFIHSLCQYRTSTSIVQDQYCKLVSLLFVKPFGELVMILKIRFAYVVVAAVVVAVTSKEGLLDDEIDCDSLALLFLFPVPQQNPQ